MYCLSHIGSRRLPVSWWETYGPENIPIQIEETRTIVCITLVMCVNASIHWFSREFTNMNPIVPALLSTLVDIQAETSKSSCGYYIHEPYGGASSPPHSYHATVPIIERSITSWRTSLP